MSPADSNRIDKLETRLFGEDGEAGAIGQVRSELRAIKSDMDKIKGALILAGKAFAFLGFSGGLLLLGALVQLATGVTVASD